MDNTDKTDKPEDSAKSEKSNDAWDEIKRIRDEIKLKAHLLAMDAKDAWENLQPKLHELEHKVSHAGASVSEDIQAALTKAKESLIHIKDKIVDKKA